MNAMRTVSLRNLRAHKVRLALTVISVLLGTAFVAGSFVLTDTLRGAFNTIFDSSDKGIDTRVRPQHSYDPGVPTSLVASIRAVPGAATVEPEITGTIVLVGPDGKKIQSNGAPSVGSAWAARSVNPVPGFQSGHAPQRPGEVAVNDGAATLHHLRTGDKVKVVVANARVVDATISGVYKVDFDTGGFIEARFTPAEAMRLFTDGTHYSAVDVAAASGVSEQTLTDRIATILPSGLEAKTGTQIRDEETQDIGSALSFINSILLGFGIVALLVGTFIIYNTFSMIVAQRQRELALLRAIGASRKQVRRSVVFEAAAIGLLGSALGLAGGVGLAFALHALLDALNLGLPSGGLVMSARTVIVTMALGTIVTLLAAFTPARRAAKIPPVAAMREEFATTTSASLRKRTIAGVAFLVIGVAVTIAGAAASSAGSASSLTGLGLVAVCAAALLLCPVFAKWIIVPLGRVVGRPFGTVGQLARNNAVRNPRRTAATAFALTLGLVLVAGIAVLGSSVKTSLNKVVDTTVTADFIVTTNGELGVPQPAADAVANVQGVGSTTTLYGLDATIDGDHQYGTGVDGSISSVAAIDMKQGRAVTSGNNLLISADTAKTKGWALGQSVGFSAIGSPTITERVTGIYADNELLGPFLASAAVYRQLTPRDEWSAMVVLVNVAPGADDHAVQDGLDAATNNYYVVTVETKEGFKGEIAGQVNGLIGLLYGLLGLAIVIAILGIINTLALSVVERRREIGMLRAIGMQRKQVRRTIYLESLLIAVFGALLGIMIGISYGSLITRALHGQGLDTVSVPWGQSIAFLVLAAIVGVLAALWPGIRAARTRPLAAIVET
jgi:putative ABC transport system permease protein